MKQLTQAFAKHALIYFLAFAVLAFTPLSFLPKIWSLAVEGMHAFVLVFLIAGAPFGGFLFLLLFSRSGERLRNTASLTGVWIGTISGSVTGVKLLELS